MRVITGSARGRKLETLMGDDVRPTTDKVKESIFSIIQFDIEGRNVLDLFAGSGQLGIEALSRGARSATFVDASNNSIEIIKSNLKKTGLTENAKVIKSDFAIFLRGTDNVFDIVFLDPPYYAGVLEKSLKQVAAVISNHGIIVCEHHTEQYMPDDVGELNLIKRYKYGKIYLSIYRKRGGMTGEMYYCNMSR